MRSTRIAFLLTLAAGLLACGGSPKTSNRWSATGSLAIPRSAFTVTRLSNGKVLVAGGQIDSTGPPWEATATAELYDPSTRTWSPVASMAAPRRWACASLLPSGKVLVAGGDNPAAGVLATAEVYDPAGNAWAPTAGPMATKRLAPACASLTSGEVLVSGGQDSDAERTSERFDPATSLFVQTGSMATGRSFHSSTVLLTGQVLVVGGCSALSAPSPCDTSTATAELYDPATGPATGTWSAAGSLPSGFGVGGHTATRLPNGDVLVAGGCHIGSGTCPDTPDQRHVSLFHPPATWTDKGFLASGRVLGAALLLSNGDVVVAAGDYHAPDAVKRSSERYVLATGTIEGEHYLVAFHGSRVGATRLDDGTWLVVGGNLFVGGDTAQNTGAADIFRE